MAAIEELFFNDAARSDENLACFQKTRPATARFVLPDPKEFPVTQRGGLSACPARVAAAAGRPEPSRGRPTTERNEDLPRRAGSTIDPLRPRPLK
jgi:hypothetical protein